MYIVPQKVILYAKESDNFPPRFTISPKDDNLYGILAIVASSIFTLFNVKSTRHLELRGWSSQFWKRSFTLESPPQLARMGVDAQQHRTVTGLFNSRLSSVPGKPVFCHQGRRLLRGSIKDYWKDLKWREEVARQRQQTCGAVLRLGSLGVLWWILLCQLFVLLPSICLPHTQTQLLDNTSKSHKIDVDLGFGNIYDRTMEDILVPLSPILLR